MAQGPKAEFKRFLNTFSVLIDSSQTMGLIYRFLSLEGSISGNANLRLAQGERLCAEEDTSFDFDLLFCACKHPHHENNTN